MAARKCNTLQGLRLNHIVELSRQGAVYDNSNRVSQSNKKCAKGKLKLQKEYFSKICINDNVSKLPQKVSDDQLKGRRYSSKQTRTDSGDNISKIPDNSLAIVVDDPELLDVICSINKKESDIRADVNNVNINKKTVQAADKIVTEKSCEYSTTKVSQECTNLEANINKSDLVNFFESFTPENSITKKPKHTYPSNVLVSTRQEIETELFEGNATVLTLEDTNVRQLIRQNNGTNLGMETESSKAKTTIVVPLNEIVLTDDVHLIIEDNIKYNNKSMCLQFPTVNNSTTKENGLEDIFTSQSSVIVEIRQDTAAKMTESNTQYNSNNDETYLETYNNNSDSSAEVVLVSNRTQVQLPIQPDINIVQHERNEPNNSNDSISILFSSPEPLNRLNLESELRIYEDTAEIIVDREWIPGSDDKHTSDTDVTDAESQPGDQNFQPNNNLENGKVKKNRKRIADPSKWNDIVNKKRRERGEAYKGWSKHKGEKAKRGAERSERKLEPACTSDHCKKTRDCQKIIESQREFMFNFFWQKMSWDQKKVYVASRVSSEAPKRRTTGDGNTSRRKASFAYSLKISDGKIFKVCKKMFLSTLGLNEWMVKNWIKESKAGMSESTKERNTMRHKERTTANRKDLEDFIDQLPKLPSHYCRKSTAKTYLEPTFRNSMSEIYNEYIKKCATFNPPQKPLSRFTFDMVMKEKNIGFQPPKKDRCDLCISYETGNVEEEAYRHHLAKKEKARDEKNKDKSAAEEGSCDVLTMDLQAVKICPSLNASALYYKTKLCVHNFTVYNINTHHCRCYWFDETDADLTANTFASCLIDYLSNTISEKPVIIWSDGCTIADCGA